MKREEEKSGGFELAWWRSRGADEIISDSEQMLLDDSRLSTGSNEVDNALNGGIPKKILFEITGEAGTGKTQWCLTLITSVLLRGVDLANIKEFREDGAGIVCVVFTENGAFPEGRLTEILKSRLEFEYLRVNSKEQLEEDEERSLDVLSEKLINCVKTYKIPSLEDMYIFVQRVIPGICLNHKVDAIFIDSITNIYRSKVSFSEKASASTGLMQFSNIFKRISVDQDCWLIVTNQTTTEVDDVQVSSTFTGLSSGGGILGGAVASRQKPSLGLVWSNSINWRIFLSKRARSSLRALNMPYRELRVELSSEIPGIR